MAEGPVSRGAINGGGKELSGTAGRKLSALTLVGSEEVGGEDSVIEVDEKEGAAMIEVSLDGFGWNDECLVEMEAEEEREPAIGRDADGADGEACQSSVSWLRNQ